MLFDYLSFEEEESFLLEQNDQAMRKLLTSKMKSLEQHLESLVQKKIRLDIEIKRTKKKLSKLKTSGSDYIKARIELEGFSLEQFGPDQEQMFLESLGLNTFLDFQELDQLVDRAEQLIQEVEDLPLFEK